MNYKNDTALVRPLWAVFLTSGSMLAFLCMFIHSSFPIVSKVAYDRVPALWTGAISSIFATIFFGVIVVGKGSMRFFWCRLRGWRSAMATSLLNGVIQWTLFFIGLQYTSASNAAVCGTFEVVFSAFLMSFIRNERLTRFQWMGVALIVLGCFGILIPDATGFSWGDLIIISAFVIGPIGSHFSKLALTYWPASNMLLLRSALCAVIMSFIAYIFQGPLDVEGLFNGHSYDVWGLLVINGFLVFGLSKLLWAKALTKIPVTLGTSILCLSPLITMALSAWLMNADITWLQWALCIPVMVGVQLMLRKKMDRPASSLG